jgi:pilus assembly protein FimV
MVVRKLAAAIFVASALNSPYLSALGLGEFKLESALNQPLDGKIQLLNVGDLTTDQILVNLASREEFEQAGVDREFFLTNIKFNVVLDGQGKGYIRLKTNRLVREPYLNFLIEARWPNGRLLREYTALSLAAQQLLPGLFPGHPVQWVHKDWFVVASHCRHCRYRQ